MDVSIIRAGLETAARRFFGRRPAVARLILLTGTLAVAAVLAGSVFASLARAANGDFVIRGMGYGHAMGMSQWGAWYAARQGVGYKKILAFYYPGTTLTSLKDPGRLVKIRITRGSAIGDGYYKVDLKPTGASATLVLHAPAGDETRKLAVGDGVTATYSGARVKVAGIAGTFEWIEIRPASAAGRVAVTLKASSSTGAGVKAEYWGKLRLEKNGSYGSLRLYNTVLLERYLRSVAEIDPGWANARSPKQYAPECVKAQQIAARTYAVYHSSSAYLYDNTLDQVYLGYSWEAAHPGVRAGVEATAGQILTYKGRPIGAYFSAHSGGYLSDTAWSDSGAPAYIVAKADPWSLKAPVRPWTMAGPGWSWTYTISPAGLTAKLKNVVSVGTITQLDIAARDTKDSGSHATSVRITGTAGTATISARLFRAKLGLKSTLILSVTGAGALGSPTRYEAGDSHLDYRGPWEIFTTDSASGGGYKRAAEKGASVTVTFKGTYLAWVATAGKTLGKAYVSLDGKKAVRIDLERSAVAYQQRVWNTGSLASGVHTVKIWWDPANKAGKFISVDAFEVKGALR